jgi:hypothetical protein
VATVLLWLAALLLAVPGAFIAARGLSGLRRGFVIVRGRQVDGRRGRLWAVALVLYGLAMIALAGIILAATIG